VTLGWAIFAIWLSCNVGLVLGLFWASRGRT
jgi:hypothetical protein